jgi:glycosyltransferase involved in cell wall biosynthesis
MQALIIAYHFPPIGGAGSQRSAKFVRYLPDFGVQPVVVAGPMSVGGRWEPRDVTQVEELPTGTPVYRPSSGPPELTDSARWQKVIGSDTDRELWWGERILEMGLRAARDHPVDAVYVSLLPYEGLGAAVELGHRLDLPVVADLRDPWALDEVRLYLSRLHRLAEQRTMGRLLDRCALVIGNTPEATQAIGTVSPNLGGHRLITITNGYDGSDFEGMTTRRADGRFRIVHTGYLHVSVALAQGRHRALKRLLGGSLWPIDLLGRSHYYLLAALSLLRSSHPDLTDRIEVVLAGVLSEADAQIVRESPVRDQVRTLGYLEHRAAIEEMVAADALFLPMHDIPSGHRARIVPGKTYEYLASGRPILAAVPPGDARDLVVNFESGFVVSPSDIRGIARAIEMMARKAPSPRRVPRGIERFERRELTRQLAHHLKAL